MIIWFTGLSGSGKTTLAKEIHKRCFSSLVLDGDEIRSVIGNKGYDENGRRWNVEMIGNAALILEHLRFIPIVSLMSPFRDQREYVRGKAKKFIEIWVSTPIEECIKRDPKGIYKKCFSNITGIDSLYEEPKNPEIIINTAKLSIEECIKSIQKKL